MIAISLNTTVISHDPYGRFETIRRVITTDTQTCSWCGQNRNGRLFQYGINRDDRCRDEWQSEYFCSIGCMHDYHS